MTCRQFVLYARDYWWRLRGRLPWPQIHHGTLLFHRLSIGLGLTFLVSWKILGLVLQAIIGFIMSGLYSHLTKHIGAFAVIYGIFLSFGELGPGNCLGLLAAKSGPTAVRGQFYGIAAAIGKVGAFVGTWSMSYFSSIYLSR